MPAGAAARQTHGEQLQPPTQAPPTQATPTPHPHFPSGFLQNGRSVRENSVALRYISDPTNNNQLETEACSHGTHWQYCQYFKLYFK